MTALASFGPEIISPGRYKKASWRELTLSFHSAAFGVTSKAPAASLLPLELLAAPLRLRALYLFL